MPRKHEKSNRQTTETPPPMRREAWKVVVYYLFVSHDLSERRESYLMAADTRLAAINQATTVLEKGLFLPNGALIDVIPPHRVLQITIYSEVV